ncbi:MAG TPA: LLM class flavin-dependent oxidoreductase [Xanthobacteraceae bacterium]|jgi:5,10-methylenetetrahydromethanopterin reductase|nr:LLM class flavin-dependent oxidoreductase [Xanthobacteraceae bacterium]
MNSLPKISIRVDGSMPPRDCVELAKAADDAGFAGVWFAENAFARGILPAAAACAVATARVRINAGVFNPYSRHPTMMAMEIGALDELSGGRASLSIGAGIQSAAAKMGFDAEKPVPALRDTLAIVRGLLHGEEVDHAGPGFSARKIRLNYRPRADIPVYLAGRGHLTVKLAGEAADGLLVSNMCSLEFAGRLAEAMRSSARAAGRDAPRHVVQYMPCATHSDSRQALNAAKHAIGDMLPRFWALGQKLGSAKDALLSGTPMGEDEFADVAARLRAGGDPAQVLDDRYALAFSLAGTPDECLKLAASYKAAGIDELALTFSGPTAKEEIAAIGGALARAEKSYGR